MDTRPKVGMVVCLNDEGLKTIQLTTQKEFEASRRMTITWVGFENITFPEETWEIEVDQPLINEFLLFNWSVDELKNDT